MTRYYMYIICNIRNYNVYFRVLGTALKYTTCTGFTKLSQFISSILFLACICICLGRSRLIQTRPQRATANVPHYQLAAATQPPAKISLHSIYIQAAIEELQTCLTHSLSDRLAGYEECLPVTGMCEN